MRLIDIVTGPWALMPEKLAEIRAIYETHLRGEKIDIAGVEARLGQALVNEPKPYQVVNGVAVVPMVGVLAKRANMFMQISGGTSTQLIDAWLTQAANDSAVRAIVLEGDTPGGQVDGVMQLAGKITAIRAAGKPVWTWGTGVVASGGYWIASATDRVVIADLTTVVGSIGVVATHVDTSAADQADGRKVTEITAGKYKRIASSHAPLTPEGRQTIQDQVDAIYSVFVEAVAANRGVSVEKVLNDMADGRVFIGQQALDVGLVDGVATLDAVIAELSSSSNARPGVGRTVQATTTTKGSAMNSAELKAAHPETYEAVRKEGYDAGLKQGVDDGTKAERTRMLGLDAVAVVGHDDLLKQAKTEGWSDERFALAVVKAESQTTAAAAAEIAKGAAKPVKSEAAEADAAAGAQQQSGVKVPPGYGVDQSRAALDAKARAYAAEHNCSYVDALKAVQ